MKASGTGAAIALVAALAMFAVPARAAEVAGVELDDSIELGGALLQLNGAGERTLYVVRTYVAALYVARPSSQAQALLGQPGPRRLSLTMLAALSTDWVVERIVAAMRANMGEEAFALLQPRLARLLEPLVALERLQKGDRVDVDVIGGSIRVRVDGRALGAEAPGGDLFDALLRAFIGERPLDAALGRALLGLPPPKDATGNRGT
ncbi:MAG: chalcone isomerase family protein [Burkholderiaceae bacterium]|nr:chalcone isomerase family protein [Burkholderiaceae bacterium]